MPRWVRDTVWAVLLALGAGGLLGGLVLLGRGASRLGELRAYERAVPCVEGRPLGACVEDATVRTSSTYPNRHGDLRTVDFDLHLPVPGGGDVEGEPVTAVLADRDYREGLPPSHVGIRQWRGRVTRLTVDGEHIETIHSPAYGTRQDIAVGAATAGVGLWVAGAGAFLWWRNSKRPAYVTHPGGAGWRG